MATRSEPDGSGGVVAARLKPVLGVLERGIQGLRGSMIPAMLILCGGGAASAQVSVGINLPGISIGINQPAYPDLVLVPGYPVYYAPGSPFNYFFYDGLYWVYQDDEWYCSDWYDGPWSLVEPAYVPLYVLRVPVRYYRLPPPYFRGWDRDAPPRWGDHWGRDWERRRSGWDHWDHRAAPAPAPLPVYQRQYAGDRYPPVEQQRQLQSRNYRYVPREAVSRARQQQRAQAGGAPAAPRAGQPPQPPPARPDSPHPPFGQPLPPSARPGSPAPVAPRYQPGPARPGSPGPPEIQREPPPRPGYPNPPAVRPPRAEPPPQEHHEAPHGNPGQGRPRPPREEPGKGPG